MSDRYAVMGNPVAHSKSPFIHTSFARQCRQDLRYEALLAPLDGFKQAAEAFFAGGGKGLNVTVPFKQDAWALARRRSVGAELAGAVNTLLLNAEGELEGHNTDGPGLVRDLTVNAGGELRDKRVLVLGAGGATRGIVLPLLQLEPVELVIANRTRSKAEELAALFAAHGRVSACGYEDLPGQRFDWVLNATAASLEGSLPPLPDDLLAQDAWCYDLMYAKEPTIFCRWAQEHGAARALDGLGMLVEQAAEAFLLWRGMRPDTREVLRELRAL
ncbi:MAG: shikimate dehydrogenase [Pseudomonadales bacterium]|nr:shikimate dehydrogenase [Pseudomonadales bacterium]